MEASASKGAALMMELRLDGDLSDRYIKAEEARSLLAYAGVKNPTSALYSFAHIVRQSDGEKMFKAESILLYCKTFKPKNRKGAVAPAPKPYLVHLPDRIKEFYIGVAKKSNKTVEALLSEYLQRIANEKLSEIEVIAKKKMEEFYAEIAG
jgi:hypothetical protein